MPRGQQLAFNTLIVGISKMSSALAVFIALPFYTQHLSTSDYGFIDVVSVYALLIAPLVSLRIELGMFRWLISARGSKLEASSIFSETIRVVLLGIFVFTLIFIPVAYIFHIPFPLLIYFYISTEVLSGVVLQLARGLGKIKVFALSGLAKSAAATIVGIVSVVVFDLGITGVFFGLIIGNLIAVFFASIPIKAHQYITLSRNPVLKGELLKFSLPMIPDGLFGRGISAGGKLIISLTLGIAANGIYAVSHRFVIMYSGLFEIFNITWMESASLHVDSVDREKYFSKVMDAALRFFGGTALCLLALIPIIFPFLVDEEFSQAYIYIPVLLLGFFFETVARVIGGIYVALKLTQRLLMTTALSSAIGLAGTIAFIAPFGLWAPVCALSVAFLVMSIHRYIDLRSKNFKIEVNAKTLALILAGFFVLSMAYYSSQSYVAINFAILIASIAVAAVINRDIIKIVYVSVKR